jgi:hypothetical protein
MLVSIPKAGNWYRFWPIQVAITQEGDFFIKERLPVSEG